MEVFEKPQGDYAPNVVIEAVGEKGAAF